MGLLDELGKIAGAVIGQKQATAGNPALLQALMSMLANGGLESLLKGFEQKGLGQVVGSWVSTGKNLPVSADQITAAFGQDRIGQLARSSGLDSGAVTKQLAALLPGLVDKLTPDGSVPERDALEQGLGMLKGLLK